jgi:ATP-binding cassette subfamily B (MDR/TAP) protein 1
MALITIGCIPIIVIGVIAMSNLQWKKNSGFDNKLQLDDPYLKSNALLSDVILNYRTVISFGEKNIDSVIKKYEYLLIEPASKRIRTAHIAGFFFGYSQAARMIFVGIVFYLGTIVARKMGYKGDKIFIAIWILFSCAFGAGSAMSNVPSVKKARESAEKIFDITDEKSTLDVRETTKEQLTEIKEGKIVFKDVDFKYPSRSTKIFNQFNMEIPATFKIALVGHSGCGKSTITNLLLRFYHTHAGKILIDDEPIENYNVGKLREQIGFVQQEPVLFNRTIKENVLYGNLDADNAKIRKVCEMANALTFIESNIEDLDKEKRI